MTDNEKIRDLKETVDAVKELSSPWRKAFFISSIVQLVMNIVLAILCGMLIYFAYMAPEETSYKNDIERAQDFENSKQTNSYSSDFVTKGE